ncbi:MAG: 4Fe-4S binding protein [Myxococcota bacterium]
MTPADDPLAFVRGGRFARAFALVVAVIGLVWIGAHRVQARNLAEAQVRVHADLRDDPRFASMVARLAAPPMPPVEDITPDRSGEGGGEGSVPPMPAVEDITPDRSDEGGGEGSVPPMPPVEDITPDRSDEGGGEGGVPPMPAVEDITPAGNGDEEVYTDRFGRKRTKSGALILDEEGGGEEGIGLDPGVVAELDQGGFFDPTAFDDAKTVKKKAYVHLMPGIPNSVFFASGVVILLLSFLVFERYGKRKDPRSRERGYWRLELTRWPWLARAIKSRWFQPAVQLPVVIGFLAVIVAGLVGSQEPGRNIAPVLTWNIWWIGLIFAVFFFGNLWCFMCPWTAIPDWASRLSLTSTTAIRSLGKKYPRFKLWMWPAIILFAVITWLEIIYDAANRPWLTSVIAIFMVVLSWVMLVLYERKAMCRYVCFVGRVSGQYAMMGMVELRRRDPEICRRCENKDCYRGREGVGLPCPTHEFMGAMNENQYCTLCTECVKSCPHDNIALNVRSSGADILYPHRSRKDEAYMAILVFIVSAFHGAAMIPLWMEWEDAIRGFIIDTQTAWLGQEVLGFSGSQGGTMTFTLMMLACIFIPGLVYWLLCAAMRWASGRPDIKLRRVFIRFAYTLLPIALFYHLAHNATHVFYEWSKLRRLVSDPLGWGTDYFGTARAPLSALWSPESIWYLQVALIIIGHIYGILVAQREAFRLYDGDRKASLRVHLVMMVGMVAMSMLSLWLLAQPMFMRTAEV